MTMFPSYLPPTRNTRSARSAQILLASPRSQSQLIDFSQISQNPPRAFTVHDVIHISWSYFLPGIFILTYVNDTSSPRQHLHSSLHLTNSCAKRKVLSLTKPKGRIYKTKSLGHYITQLTWKEELSKSFHSDLLPCTVMIITQQGLV